MSVKSSLAIAFLLSVLCAGPCWGQTSDCDSDTNGACCICNSAGHCQTETPFNVCKCRCHSVGSSCTSSGVCAVGGVCKFAPRLTPQALAQTPWATSPRIVNQLVEHSVVPSPDLIYDQVMIAELKAGRVGHHGVVLDPQQQRKYREWWDLDDNSSPDKAHLRIWLDEDGVWKLASDVHQSKVRLPVTETVDFFEDHWEQVNAKGRFSGQVEPYTASDLAQPTGK
jgi:hypothetical protein